MAIQSMTGFGKATGEFNNKKITVEIKSLNNKQLDLSVRIPNIYRGNELYIRNLISQKLKRGKIDFLIYTENVNHEINTQINQHVIEAYYHQIKSSADTLGIPVPSDWFQVLMRLPDVLKYEIQEADDAEWKCILQIIEDAINQLLAFRIQEGNMLQKLFDEKIHSISQLSEEVVTFEGERIDKVKSKIIDALKTMEVDYDRNRFEQEIIYYIEKLDINEEKTRLKNHLHYFIETMLKEDEQGKKLGFITQEMGREINTMGSKANHANIQQIVVKMKDELEQIKEQVLNVL